MESHGKNPRQIVTAVIPARYESTRLRGKLLLPLGGKPLILHTLDRARAARNVDRVIVATDDDRIYSAVTDAGCEAAITSSEHRSGSDRIAEVAGALPLGSVVVNVQGDEPLISPSTIEKAVDAMLSDDSADIATTCEPISHATDVTDPNVVKVVADSRGYALYFSRSPIPFPRDAVMRCGGALELALRDEPGLLSRFRKHTGLYVYRREYLLEFRSALPTSLEETESLEQLRALQNGARIRVVEVEEPSIGVDTLDDYNRVRGLMEANV